MIISNSKKFIYFHIPKTGGTSIALQLGRYSENLDIWPQLRDVVDEIDKNPTRIDGVFINKLVQERIASIPNRCFNDFYIRDKSKVQWMNIFHYGFDLHPVIRYDAFIQQALDRLEGTLYDEYFKFAIVRNPWDYVMSIYKNKVITEIIKGYGGVVGNQKARRNELTKEKFNYFLKTLNKYPDIVNTYLNPTKNQIHYIMDGWDRVDPNCYIARFENYENELKYISSKIGIPLDSTIHVNKSIGSDIHYSELYTEHSMEFIRKMFNKDIEYFEYEFEK